MATQQTMQLTKGFTLIEFVLVLLIGAIVWGVTSTGYHHLNTFRASLIYENTIQLLVLANKVAKTTGKNVKVHCQDRKIFLDKDFVFLLKTPNVASVEVPKKFPLLCERVYEFSQTGRVKVNNLSVTRAQLSIATFSITIEGNTAYVY